MSLLADGARAVPGDARDQSAILERRARAHRLLLEAEMRLQSGAERDEEAIIPLAAGLLRDILGGDLAIVCYTIEAERETDGETQLRLLWRYGYGPNSTRPGPVAAAVPLLLDGDIAGHTARARQPRLWPSFGAAQGQVGRGAGDRADDDVRGGAEARARFSILSLPLLYNETILGVINAYRPAVLPFDQDDLSAAVIFSRGVAVAVMNARLNARLIEAEARARELVEHSPDMIVLHTADGLILEANAAAGELIGLASPRLIGTLLTDYLDEQDHEALHEAIAEAVAVSPAPSPAEFRYRRPDGSSGILHIRTRRLRETDQEGRPLLQSIARDVTFEQRQRQALETKVRELDLLIGVGENLNSSLHLEAVLRKTLRALLAVVSCPAATILLYDEAGQLLVPVAAQGWPEEEEPLRPVGLASGPIGAAVRAGRIAFVADLTRLPDGPQLRRPDSPRAMLIVPFMRGSDPLGCFTLLRPLGQPFNEGERRLAAAVARQTAIAIENARLFGRVQHQLRQIQELQGLTADLVADLDLDPTLARICHTLAGMLGAEKTTVRFLSDAGDILTLAAQHGLSPSLPPELFRAPAQIGEHGEALRTGDCVITPDLRRVPSDPFRDLLLREGIIANCTVPIIGKGRAPLGVLNASWSTPHTPTAEEIELVRTYANYAAAAIENARLYNRTRELYLAGVQSLAATVDARDAYTHRHSRNVAFYAREMARELGLPQAEVEAVELAALLHDIGKIGISDAILGKRGKLSTSEMSVMITHAQQGAAILSVNPALAHLVPLVKHHHEWYNGSGYPDGLAGEEVPLGAAIISVADAFDTMTTDRAYRRARTFPAACEELRHSAGRQFSPRVIDAFLRVLERDDALDAAYLRPLRERGTSHFTSALMTLAEAGHRDEHTGELEADPGDTGQIRPQQLKELSVLHHLARTVGSITDLGRFLDSAVDLIKRELGYADCAILLREEENGDLVVRALSGFDDSVRGQRFPADDGLFGWVMTQGLSQNIADSHHDQRYDPWLPTNHSALLAPLIYAGQSIGVIVIESTHEGAFSADDELTLETIANQLTTGIAVARLHDREKRAAITDGLTGVFNHRYFYQRLEQELGTAETSERTLTVLIIDVNGLKALNDTYGHVAGDSALRLVASILRDSTREDDTVARYGGDEFAIILPGTTIEDADRLIARLRSRLHAQRTTGTGTTLAPISFAAGVALYPTDGTRASVLIALADERMYTQKRASKTQRLIPPADDERSDARQRLLSRVKGR